MPGGGQSLISILKSGRRYYNNVGGVKAARVLILY